MCTNGVSKRWLQTWRVKGVTCVRQYGAMEVEGRQWKRNRISTATKSGDTQWTNQRTTEAMAG